MSNNLLESKTLIMLVGPSAIGKSTLMNEMATLHDDFAYVRAFTTRPPRPGEKGHYRFIDQEAAQRLKEEGRAITYVEHPTTQAVYGTTIESFPKQYNLLDTLSGSVHEYRSLPFKATVTLTVTAPINEWHQWFISRYPDKTPEAEKRLAEAILSIEWALQDPQTYWITNQEGSVSETAQKAIDTVLHPPQERDVPPWPRAMLHHIKEELWHKR